MGLSRSRSRGRRRGAGSRSRSRGRRRAAADSPSAAASDRRDRRERGAGRRADSGGRDRERERDRERDRDREKEKGKARDRDASPERRRGEEPERRRERSDSRGGRARRRGRSEERAPAPAAASSRDRRKERQASPASSSERERSPPPPYVDPAAGEGKNPHKPRGVDSGSSGSTLKTMRVCGPAVPLGVQQARNTQRQEPPVGIGSGSQMWDDETAIDYKDGKRKTKRDFKRAYGGFDEWDNARAKEQEEEIKYKDFTQFIKEGSAPPGKLRGTVMTWIDDKGIGYIHGPGNPPGAGGVAPPIFIHRTQLPNANNDALLEGHVVFYELQPDLDRPGFQRACKVCGPALKSAGRGSLSGLNLPARGSLAGKSTEGKLVWGRQR
eukprot:TRINITY_DN2118_c0_g9_i1.p1 TRINITY_DN2118_c0_g9~~TRINITY_DN2118_c0_g9_i1.p1  ORF type:complete len:383 (+),score=83.70 TRINITY_DN2118_c0_g9_i1:132-1280(+)